MDLQFLWMIFRTIMALCFVIFLIYLSVKYGGGKLQYMQSGKFVKILERTQLSKENSLILVRLGEKVCVIASSAGSIEIIYQLKENEISQLKDKKNIPQYKSLGDLYKKLKYKKEDNKHE